MSSVRRFDSIWETLAPGLGGAHVSSTLGRAATQIAPSARSAGPPLPVVTLGADGELRLEQVLGEGGMGIVHAAVQRALSREVAVKRVRPALSDDPATRELLLSEAALAGGLEHPNIVPIHMLGRDAEGAPLMVMKRVVGEPWLELITDEAHAAWSSFASLNASDRLRSHLEILIQVCNAVSFAHDRGVLHRDIKPDNVLVGAYGEVHLADWGVAARVEGLRHEGVVGTPQYLAPELIDGALQQGSWTDVYLLGATLHHVLVRAPRHEGATLRAVLAAAYESHAFHYPPQVPAELAELANRATSREPADRPQTAADFRRALSEFLLHRGSASLTTTTAARLAERPRSLTGPRAVEQAFRIATECRFGFLTALREWKDNADAQRGLREAVETLVRVELARENAAGARALLAELSGDPPEELARLLSELEATLAARDRERAQLLRMARENDPTPTSGARLGMALVVVAAGMALLVASWNRAQTTSDDHERPRELVLIGAGLVVFVIGLAVVARRRLLSNAFGRRAAIALLCTLCAIFVNRCLALWDGRPIVTTLRADMVLGALGFALVGVFAARVWWIGATLLLAGALSSMAWPDRAGDLFGAFATAALASAALLERRRDAAGGS